MLLTVYIQEISQMISQYNRLQGNTVVIPHWLIEIFEENKKFLVEINSEEALYEFLKKIADENDILLSTLIRALKLSGIDIKPFGYIS